MTVISTQEREHLLSFWKRTLQKAKLQKKVPDTIQNGNSSIQQEEGQFYKQIRLKMNEEISAVLHFEHSSIWCS